MIVFCVSRQPGAVDDVFFQNLSQALSLRNVDKAYIESKLGEYGFSVEKTRKFDEHKPSFFASLSMGRDEYLHYLKTMLYDEALKESCMIVGRGGFRIFEDVPGVLKVFLVSPRSTRIDNIASQYKCDEKQAEHILKKKESDREGFYRFFFNTEWLDPANYDFCINIKNQTSEQIIQVLKGLMASKADIDDSVCRTRIAELALGCRIINEISYVQNLPIHFAEAEVKNGFVTLQGVASTLSAAEAAVIAAKSVPGVKKVESSIQIVQNYQILS